MNPRSIILAIETAIGGGSISVIRRDGTMIGAVSGVSRAEDLLIGIERLLADSNLPRNAIDLIAVSLGPGSFTGIRIGIATALGLSSSLGAKCVGVDAFEAISLSFPNEDVVVVLPLGRGYFAFQEFSQNSVVGRAQVVTEEEMIHTLSDRSDTKILFLSESESAGVRWKLPENFLACTESLSTLIGRCALAGGGRQDIKPLYLRHQGRVGSLQIEVQIDPDHKS